MKTYTVKELRKILKELKGAYNMNYTKHFLDYLGGEVNANR